MGAVVGMTVPLFPVSADIAHLQHSNWKTAVKTVWDELDGSF